MQIKKQSDKHIKKMTGGQKSRQKVCKIAQLQFFDIGRRNLSVNFICERCAETKKNIWYFIFEKM